MCSVYPPTWGVLGGAGTPNLTLGGWVYDDSWPTPQSSTKRAFKVRVTSVHVYIQAPCGATHNLSFADARDLRDKLTAALSAAGEG